MGNNVPKLNLVTAILTVVVVSWGIAEFGIHILRPDAIEREYRVSSQFKATSDILWDRHAQLQVEAVQLSGTIADNIDSRGNVRSQFLQRISGFNTGTITALYKDQTLISWSDGMTESLHNAFVSGKTALHTDEFGLYLFSSSGVRIDGVNWKVIRAKKLFGIANPGSRFGDVYETVDPALSRLRPAPFYLVGSPDRLPGDYRFNLMTIYDELTSGYFVLSVNEPIIRSYIHPQLDLGVRTLFFVAVLILLWIMINIRFDSNNPVLRTGYKVLLISISSVLAWNLDVYSFIINLLTSQSNTTHTYLIDYVTSFIIGAIVLAIIAYIIIQQLLKTKRYFGFTWYPRTITVSLVYGITLGLSFAFYGKILRYLARLDVVEIVDISLIPSIPTMWIFFVAGLFGLTLITLNAILAWFLMNSEQDQINWVHPLVLSGALFSYYLGSESYTGSILGFWFEFIWVGLFAFATYYIAWLLYRKPHILKYYAVTRGTAMAALIVTLLSFPSFYGGVDDMYESAMLSLAKEAVNPDSWRTANGYTIQSPYLTVVYSGGTVERITGDFASGQFPDNAVLPRRGRTLYQGGSSSYGTESGPHFTYRELAYRPANINKVVIVQARKQNFNNYVYSFFRYYIFLLALGIIFLGFVRLSGKDIFLLKAQNRFQNRIQDTYLLSSFIFLILLVIVTQSIIKHQNDQNIELEIVENLDLLQYGLRTNDSLNVREELFLGFDFLYYPLSGELPKTDRSDISYSLGKTELLPFDIYNGFIRGNDRRTLKWTSADNKRILLGYRAIIEEDTSLSGVIAIPAISDANKYMDQILQTVSFLILFYIIIFGLFITGGILISLEILRPIQEFRQGLQRLSAGDMTSEIKVKNQYEIGELANAFNLMVYKLKDLQDELAESERQSAWTEMARQVAHEIKNPLTPMKLSIQHLYQQIEYNDKTLEEIRPLVRRISTTLVQEIDSLSNIASDFSNLARPIMEDFVPTPLNDVVKDVITLYSHDERLEIYFEADDAELEILAARDELKRVFINLIKNGMEALGPTEMVYVRTYVFENQACADVIDSGKGMPAEVRKRVFIPNFSTKSSGTGFGLAICKKVVDAHKGQIRFASVSGLGTTFTITIPLIVKLAKASEAEKA